MRLIERLAFHGWYGFCSRIRVAVYRMLGLRIGPRCRVEGIRLRRPAQIIIGSDNAISAGCWLFPHDSDSVEVRIRIGSRNFFNRDVMIDACGLVEIGDHNMFGPGVYIGDANHTMSPGRWVADCGLEIRPVRIGNGCWIGARAVILSGVELGDRCTVAAGAVVTRSVAPGAVVGGVPARDIGRAVHA